MPKKTYIIKKKKKTKKTKLKGKNVQKAKVAQMVNVKVGGGGGGKTQFIPVGGGGGGPIYIPQQAPPVIHNYFGNQPGMGGNPFQDQPNPPMGTPVMSPPMGIPSAVPQTQRYFSGIDIPLETGESISVPQPMMEELVSPQSQIPFYSDLPTGIAPSGIASPPPFRMPGSEESLPMTETPIPPFRMPGSDESLPMTETPVLIPPGPLAPSQPTISEKPQETYVPEELVSRPLSPAVLVSEAQAGFPAAEGIQSGEAPLEPPRSEEITQTISSEDIAKNEELLERFKKGVGRIEGLKGKRGQAPGAKVARRLATKAKLMTPNEFSIEIEKQREKILKKYPNFATPETPPEISTQESTPVTERPVESSRMFGTIDPESMEQLQRRRREVVEASEPYVASTEVV